MTTARDPGEVRPEVLRLALAIMAALAFIVAGAMWLGANLSQGICTRRTVRQAETIVSLDSQLVVVTRQRDSLRTTLRLMVCIRPGAPPSLIAC